LIYYVIVPDQGTLPACIAQAGYQHILTT